MAIKKPAAKAASEDKKQETVEYEIKVTRAKDLGSVVMFDMTVNGVYINGCSYKELERKDGSGSFAKVNFPSHKGKNGKYYNTCYFKISDEDMQEIEHGIETLL